MANLLRRLAGNRVEDRFSADQWISEFLLPASGFANQFVYGGTGYPLGAGTISQKIREISGTLGGYSSAIRACPPAFAAEMVRALVLSQVRFTFRNNRMSSSPGRLFGNRDLATLEQPWPNGTTGELVSRMEWHAGLAGNAYVTNRQRGRLRVLRPDWVAIVYGSLREPDDPAHALDGEIIGYVYQNGGFSGNKNKPETLLPSEVAAWSPLPDPERAGLGMSWLTPAIRDIQGDAGYTEHKLMYLRNGATPNLVISGIPAATQKQFEEAIGMMESTHAGLANAYKTLYLTLGADAKVIGDGLQQMDFKGVQGASETRIAALSRVPAPLLGFSEGLSGSSLNAGNFSMARRTFADSWVYPTLQDLAATLSSLVRVPADAELWFDTSDMPILREDAKDAAEIEGMKAATIVSYTNAGFDPKSAIAAVQGQDIGLLKHTGNLSVQLHPNGQPLPTPNSNGKAPGSDTLPAATPLPAA